MATQIFSYIPDLEQMKDPTLDDVTSQNHEIHSNSVNIELEKGDLEHETKREEFLKELRAYDPILTDIKKLESVRDEIANTIDEIERVWLYLAVHVHAELNPYPSKKQRENERTISLRGG